MKRCTRREFLGIVGKGVALSMAGPVVAWSVGPARARRGRMNVLFIAVDDLRPQLGCYGHSQILSPNIDRLASQGLLFERAYCQQAVCAPSRSSLLSGLRPDSSRVHDLYTPLRTVQPDVLTLPQHFKNNGYTPISLGKVYHHRTKDDPQGWSERSWGPRGPFAGYVLKENQELVRQLRESLPPERKRRARGPATESADAPDNAYADGKTADEASQRLRALKDRPFFLAVGFLKPHLPFVCPQKYWDLYRREDIQLAKNPSPPGGAPKIAFTNWGELRGYSDMPKDGPVPDDQARTLIHGYYACVSFVDAQVGRVIDELGRLGLRTNTVVVLWGDHGWKLGEHGMWCKHTNFELDTNAPVILSVPGMRSAGRRTAALVEFVDIYPTLAQVCGLAVPEHCQGTSMAPLLRNPDQQWKTAAFSQYPRGRNVMGYTMRTRRWRYTEWIDRRTDTAIARELYDHKYDRRENVNVVEGPENAETVSTLAGMMTRGWRGAMPPGRR